jgi:4-hydroxythreonine-4-phosphate dehydrogenase
MALADVLRQVTKKRIHECGKTVLDLLKNDFKIREPKIAVCGLNPHAGENGLFGSQEESVIAPAVKKLNKECGGYFSGPFAPDAVFKKAYEGVFDCVIAMYHDQGLIPFKMTEFVTGVHLTAGLGFIRTSPVHGTAFDIAGYDRADHRSMLSALKLALELANPVRKVLPKRG